MEPQWKISRQDPYCSLARPSRLETRPTIPIYPLLCAQVVNPRTAACTKKDGTGLLITVDGRTDPAPGMTVYQFQAYVKV